MMIRVVVAAVALLSASAAHAQSPNWASTESCTVTSPEARTGQARLKLVYSRSVDEDGKTYERSSIQVIAPGFSNAKVALSGIQLEVPGKVQRGDITGAGAVSGEDYIITIPVSDNLSETGWNNEKLVAAIADGMELKLSVTLPEGTKNLSVDLAGSGAAIGEFRRCKS